MEFSYRYLGASRASAGATSAELSFAPDTWREPTYFSGRLHHALPFREAISALHDVVVSDLRRQPRDTTGYKEWAQAEEDREVERALAQREGVQARITELQHELNVLHREHFDRWKPFWAARDKYFQYLYHRDKQAWFVLDPVITVHPDQVFFECLSQDESTYGRLSANLEVFDDVGEHACGTTNVDYSEGLYETFQKIRSYKTTRFEIDRAGFDVQTTGEDVYTEVKIDLPDSWVRGFLQVSSGMTLDAVRIELHPLDVHNLCFVLRRKKEIFGPRSLRFVLKPGQPVKVLVDPWGLEVECPRSSYTGTGEHEIRLWGRRRLFILERLIPVARRFTVHLLGYGMPSYWIADLGPLTFTLGLSGWTANDWSHAGQFDLLAPRADVDDATRVAVFQALGQSWVASTDELSARTGLDRKVVLGALQSWTQAGRAVYDLAGDVWRKRELSRAPLPLDRLHFSSDRERTARALVKAGQVKKTEETAAQGGCRLKGRGEIDKKRPLHIEAVIDGDERLVEARCSCNFFVQNRLRQGPCEHILALRMLRGQDRARLFGLW